MCFFYKFIDRRIIDELVPSARMKYAKVLKAQISLYLILGSIMIISVFKGAPDTSPNRSPSSDHVSYEAVTGESADEDKTVWDTFYKNKNFAYGKEAIEFLRSSISLIPRGRAFVPAMGEGRNAIFLAKQGFMVDGNDISDVAVDKTLAEAKKQNVSIKANVADLNQYPYPESYYDFILVSLFYEKSLIPQFKKALKKGGYIMFYNKIASTTLVKDGSPSDFTVKQGELKDAFKEYKIVKPYQEYIENGSKMAVILAKKP